MTEAPDRSRPPAAGTVRRFEFPAFEVRRLDGGLELWMAPMGSLPLVDLELVFDAGAALETLSQAGLAGLTAAVLDEGTETRDSRQIAETVEHLGGSLGTSAGWDSLTVSCGLLTEHLGTGVELIADIIRRPIFPERETTRLRGQILAEIERRDRQPANLATRHLLSAVYGETRYGRPRIGSRETVTRLERSDLLSFYSDRASSARAALIVCGDFDPDHAAQLVSERFTGWREAPSFGHDREDGATQTPDVPAANRVLLVDRPGAQTELRLGLVGPPRGDADFFSAIVLNTLLGGKFTSRVNLNLRERHGYTYGASTFFDWRRGPGPFLASAAVANEHAAAAAGEVIAEIERLGDEPIPPEELEETKSYLLGVFPYGTQTLAGISARLRQLVVHDLAHDYYRRWPEAIAAVSADDVTACARRHLDPRRLTTVAVGPASELETNLARLGSVEVAAAP